ncbi:MAG: helix-turn-helix domain-containing protein [Chthoniobacteraceae bacterium]
MKKHIASTPGRAASASIDETHAIPGLTAAIDEVLKKPEVARRLRISCRTLDQWMRDGRICHLKIGKTVRFRWPDVLAHLQRNNQVG